VKWSEGPRASNLVDGDCLLAQVTRDDGGRFNVYNFKIDGAEVASGGYSTMAMAKAVAENVVEQLERDEQARGTQQDETRAESQVPKQ